MDIATLSFSAISAEIKSKMHLNNDKKYLNLTSLVVLVSLLRRHLLTNDFEKKIFGNFGEKNQQFYTTWTTAGLVTHQIFFEN